MFTVRYGLGIYMCFMSVLVFKDLVTYTMSPSYGTVTALCAERSYATFVFSLDLFLFSLLLEAGLAQSVQ